MKRWAKAMNRKLSLSQYGSVRSQRYHTFLRVCLALAISSRRSCCRVGPRIVESISIVSCCFCRSWEPWFVFRFSGPSYSPGAYLGIHFTFLSSRILVILLAYIVCGDWLTYIALLNRVVYFALVSAVSIIYPWYTAVYRVEMVVPACVTLQIFQNIPCCT